MAPVPPITIRRSRVEDAAGLVALDRMLAEIGDGMVQSVEQIATIEEEAARLARESEDIGLVATDGDRIVGSADLRRLAPMRCHHVGVLSVGVHPGYHRRGIGRALMQTLIDEAKTLGLVRLELYVRGDNHEAQALYERLGFRHESTRDRFIRLDDGSFIGDRIYALFLDAPPATIDRR
jgi:putative acetyltransferase